MSLPILITDWQSIFLSIDGFQRFCCEKITLQKPDVVPRFSFYQASLWVILRKNVVSKFRNISVASAQKRTVTKNALGKVAFFRLLQGGTSATDRVAGISKASSEKEGAFCVGSGGHGAGADLALFKAVRCACAGSSISRFFAS